MAPLPRLLPPGTLHDARVLLWTRGMRAFGDGYISLLLPYYLTLLGFDALQIGVIITATLFGAGGMTLTIGLIAHRYRARSLLMAGSALLVAVALLLTRATDFWPLLIIAAFGVLNPASGDVTVFAPLEHSMLARSVSSQWRTALFARYSVVGSLVGALGAQAAGLPALLGAWFGLEPKFAVQMMFVGYALLGIGNLLLYRSLSPRIEAPASTILPVMRLSRSRSVRVKSIMRQDTVASLLLA